MFWQALCLTAGQTLPHAQASLCLMLPVHLYALNPLRLGGTRVQNPAVRGCFAACPLAG